VRSARHPPQPGKRGARRRGTFLWSWRATGIHERGCAANCAAGARRRSTFSCCISSRQRTCARAAAPTTPPPTLPTGISAGVFYSRLPLLPTPDFVPLVRRRRVLALPHRHFTVPPTIRRRRQTYHTPHSSLAALCLPGTDGQRGAGRLLRGGRGEPSEIVLVLYAHALARDDRRAALARYSACPFPSPSRAVHLVRTSLSTWRSLPALPATFLPYRTRFFFKTH